MTPPAPSRDRSRLLSQQVSGGAYFFLRRPSARTAAFGPVFGGREQCNPDYVVRRSHFGYYGVEYVAEGAGRVCLDGRAGELGPGTVFAYAPDTDCEIRTDPGRPMLKYFVCLTGRGGQARLARAGLAPGRIALLPAHAEMRDRYEDLIREGRHHGRMTARLCAALTAALLLKIEDLGTRPARRGDAAEERFLRCRALIDARVGQPATLEEIAAAARQRPSSLCRLFRRFQGTSPYQYLLRRKMIVAAELLVESGGLVKEAAQRVGFTDPYHFSRCFKAVHGLSPSQLRGYRHSP